MNPETMRWFVVCVLMGKEQFSSLVGDQGITFPEGMGKEESSRMHLRVLYSSAVCSGEPPGLQLSHFSRE